MAWITKSWSKEDREPYKDSTFYYNKYDLGEYMEDLVDTWHTSSLDQVSLYDFLGLEEDEVIDWAGKGIVPERIKDLWSKGEY